MRLSQDAVRHIRGSGKKGTDLEKQKNFRGVECDGAKVMIRSSAGYQISEAGSGRF